MYSLSQIENNTSRSLLSKVNDIWRVLFNIQDKSAVDVGDHIIIQEGEHLDSEVGFKKIPISLLGFVQGAPGPAGADGADGADATEADITYTNDEPMPEAVGGLPAELHKN